MTDCYGLYEEFGLPLDEAYMLAEYICHLYKRDEYYNAAQKLRMEICREMKVTAVSQAEESDYCRKYMEDHGYYEYRQVYHEYPEGIYAPRCSIFRNEDKPLDQYVRSQYDYASLLDTGAVTLEEAYVLIKNKNFRYYDNDMLSMIYGIEDKNFSDMIRSNERLRSFAHDYLNEIAHGRKRTQINSNNLPIYYAMMYYMDCHGYQYDPQATNSFVPLLEPNDKS